MEILSCGHELVREEGSLGTGYGVDWDTGKKICYTCCGRRDEETMMREGRITLYLSRVSKTAWDTAIKLAGSMPPLQRFKITNWPGTVIIEPTSVKESTGYGWYGRTYPIFNFWFFGPDGYLWYGRSAGYSEIAHCRRLKKQGTKWATHWPSITQGVTQ